MKAPPRTWSPQAANWTLRDLDSACLLIFFWAEWAGLDRKLDELLQQVSLPEGVAVRSCNVDSDQEFAIKHQVMNVPTLAFFSRGIKIATLVGVPKPDGLRSWLDQHVKRCI
jgi:thioredoxin-like negative regulator of GroEL